MSSDLPTSQVSEEPRASWWQAIFEASEDALLVCNRDGVIHEANPRARKIFESVQGGMPGCLFNALEGPSLERLKASFERDGKFPEHLSSVNLLPEGPLRGILRHLGRLTSEPRAAL